MEVAVRVEDTVRLRLSPESRASHLGAAWEAHCQQEGSRIV